MRFMSIPVCALDMNSWSNVMSSVWTNESLTERHFDAEMHNCQTRPMEWRMLSIMTLMCVNLPRSVSSGENDVTPAFNIVFIECDQARNLYVGSFKQKFCTSMSQPRVFLISSRQSSTRSFHRQSISSLNIGLFGRSNGWPTN